MEAAGLIGINDTWMRYNYVIDNLGAISRPGIYIFESTSNPIEGHAYGIILTLGSTVLSNTWGWFAELFFSSDGSVFVRTAIRTSGSWGSWRKL